MQEYQDRQKDAHIVDEQHAGGRCGLNAFGGSGGRAACAESCG
jgi:hypothetical protein